MAFAKAIEDFDNDVFVVCVVVVALETEGFRFYLFVAGFMGWRWWSEFEFFGTAGYPVGSYVQDCCEFGDWIWFWWRDNDCGSCSWRYDGYERCAESEYVCVAVVV